MRRLLLILMAVGLLSTGALAQTSGSPGGLVVFETFGLGTGTDATQAGVLAGAMTTQTVLFATSSVRLSRNLGVAIVNPGSTTATVTLSLRRGTDGSMSSVKTIVVGARQQVAKFINELFADVPELPLDFDGSLAITSNTPVSILGLRFRGTNFSTIPITSLSNSAPVPQITTAIGGSDAVILPHFAAGGGWSSEIVISNTTTTPVTVRVDVFKQDGTPLTTFFNGQQGSSFVNVVIPAEGIMIQNNEDNGPLQVGYAIVTPGTTITPPGTEGPATVALGAAAPYAILAGAGVSNSGATMINGSLGTSPTGTLTGAPSVSGSTDLANPAAAAAKLALTAAYNDAAGRSLNAISLPGDLSGLTLAPGLYKNSSSTMLSAGNLTLDAQGNPNATWIFQIGSTLTTISGTQIILAGGAKAANIFWQVGSSATLGTTSIFKGNILSSISISVNTGAVVEGRLLTQTGAVSLLSNTVTVPNP